MKHFTEEQIDELCDIFGLTRINPVVETLPVRDGEVAKTDMVWWRCNDGPEHVLAERDWYNIKAYPEHYQIEEPAYTVQYTEG